ALDRDHDKLLDYLDKIIKYYDPSDKVRANFIDKMKDVMASKEQEAKDMYRRNSKEYKRIYEWAEWSKIWVRFNRKEIKEILDRK
ncbi:hypothetical protein, partial [Brachyspira sp.]|uniref:hypothetical protein n=1 Tax=Brachyspira sp. TaxID=1977261 RepID=UPI0026399158